MSTTVPPQPTHSPFAYGTSNFSTIRHERSFFVDNTHHIRLLESGYQYLFVRPPRIGKSLFVETLRHYYDCAASQAEFDALFGGLDAHTNATPLARSFHVLKLDFSIRIAGDVKQNFDDQVNKLLGKFRDHYNLEFDINPRL